MAAVNKDPFVRSGRKNGNPHTFKGLVQAGATAAIKIGEICTWNETVGYFIPVNAVADSRYPLAIAKEEQKLAVGRTGELNAARYMEFYSLHPEDVFEFPLAAAAAVIPGDPYTLTASDSQKLTAAAGAFPVAFIVDDDHFPQEINTTIRSISYGNFSFNPVASFWGYRWGKGLTGASGGRRVLTITSDETITENECYNTFILVSGATTITLPAVKPGMDLIVLNTDGNDEYVDCNSADRFRTVGAVLTAGHRITNTTIGNWCRILTEGADGFVVISGAGTEWATAGS